MIEQTEMTITIWHFHPQEKDVEIEYVSNFTTLEVMKKRAATKKGIACKLSCRFLYRTEPLLDFVGEHSYVIDLDDVVDMAELRKMIKNSFANFTEKFEFRKLGTAVQNCSLFPLDENNLNLDEILPLLG